MILFLTYHRVLATDAGPDRRDIYTVRASDFRAQLDALQAAGLAPQRPETLLSTPGPKERRCYLSFDDGTVDHAEVVLPELRARNWRAIFFVPTAKLDQPGRLSSAQVHQLLAEGHTLGCHGHEHRRMDTLGRVEMERQLDLALRTMQERFGVAAWIFAPPGGYLNPDLRAAALQRGLRVIRTMRWGVNRCLDLTALETVPIFGDTDVRRFAAVLAGQPSRGLYTLKQTVKALLPIRLYERLRALVFRLRGVS